jgi:hypothetical protein
LKAFDVHNGFPLCLLCVFARPLFHQVLINDSFGGDFETLLANFLLAALLARLLGHGQLGGVLSGSC